MKNYKDNGLTMFDITFHLIRDLENCDIMLIYISMFYTNPHNNYNNLSKLLFFYLGSPY